MYHIVCSPKGRLAIGWLLLLLLSISCKKEVVTTKVQDQEIVSGPNLSLGNYWTQLIPPVVTGQPAADNYNFSFSLNNKVYVAIRGYNQLWEFDPANSQWTKLQDNFYTFTGIDYVDVFTNGNSVYFLNPETKNLKEYNLTTNAWTDKANFPGVARAVGTSCNTSTKGYVMGGINGTHPGGLGVTLSENWEYDFAANTWTQKTNTPGFSRYNSASFAIGDNIYFGTGISAIVRINPVTFELSWAPFINNDWWEYNTITNTWTEKADFGGGTRQDTRGFVIGGKVYLGMGTSGYFSPLKSDFWSYNPASDSWTQRADYPPGNPYPPFNTMLGAGSRGYSITGNIQSFWKYTPPLTIIPNPGAIQ